MMPDKDTMCHRTSFEKSCHSIVKGCGCRLWRHFIGMDPQTGAQTDAWDCVEGMQLKFWIENARALREVKAEIEKLSNEVAKANDAGMAGALMGLNAQIRQIAETQGAAVQQIGTAAASAVPHLIEMKG